MLSSLEVLRLIDEPAPKSLTGRRLAALFRTDRRALDLFFNSASGYRAQYLCKPELGDEANRLVIDALTPVLDKAIGGRSGNTASRAFCELSLAHTWAKVWIHQGSWLRRSRRIERVLLVPSWQSELQSVDKHRRKLARWGSLAPEYETRFVLKGGYVESGRQLKICKSARERRQELHTLGFT